MRACSYSRWLKRVQEGEEILVTDKRVAPGPRVVLGRATPGSDGVFSFGVRAPEPRSYRVRTATASSPVVRMRAAPRVAIERRGTAIAVSTRPARAGSRVALQVYDRERFDFVSVARGRLDALVTRDDPLCR